MKRIVLFISLTLIYFISDAQVSLTGIVKNQQGEPLIGANVIIKESFKGIATNSKGEFRFSKLNQQTYTLVVSYLGYNTEEKSIDLTNTQYIEFILNPSTILSEEVIVKATRASKSDPVSFTNISNDNIKDNNFGQDVAYLISRTPSIVQTSDAGTGIGYTNFRIRGTDMNRINITVNGIPLNDSESHGVFWVNMPDFVASVDNIQIQRGVGTSTNGAAAFGATLNMQTKTFHKDSYAEINSFAGTFNTYRNSVSFGTGMINNKFTFDGRLSKITSDGYVDRASSDLNSYYLSGSYYTNKSLLKLNLISGKEKTYQAWNGVPKVRLENDYGGMQRYLDHWLIDQDEYENLINSNNRTYNLYTYDNETDNYQQSHYQLFYSYEFNPKLHINTALHYTQGKGYYEQFKKDRDFSDYNLDQVILTSDTIESTDLVQQKWLDNHFYGGVFSAEYSNKELNVSIGGSWNQYIGDHFGEVIWAQYASNGNIRHRWYESEGKKDDFTAYTKIKYSFFNKLNAYIDLQYRNIDYSIDGIDDDLRNISQQHKFLFFNPKAGISFQISDIHSLYATFGVANREPNRSNYTDAAPGHVPTHETLYNYELGYSFNYSKSYLTTNIYYMDYNNQLVLTGQIN
ncbi:MAG: TonB-dependent receptor, partial [Bacteroidales bacterium]|nr:TonB-dependent receptor [Bacteroidales bacterium]